MNNMLTAKALIQWGFAIGFSIFMVGGAIALLFIWGRCIYKNYYDW